MTLQDLLKPQRTEVSPAAKVVQAAKTAQLIAANKAAAAQILKNTLLKLESDKPVSKCVERKIWI